MMLKRWKICGTWTTKSPLHIGCGIIRTFDHPSLKNDQGELNAIQAVVRDYQEWPCIPGTAIKGVVRHWAEKHLANETDRIQRLFGMRDHRAPGSASGWAEFCTGMLKQPSKKAMERYQKHVPYWDEKSITGIQSHVCIDRNDGTASHNKLYFEEFVPKGVGFDIEIDVSKLDASDVEFLLSILSTGTAHPTHPIQFGANTTDGWGCMEWELKQVSRFSSIVSNAIGYGHCATVCDTKPLPIEPAVPTHIAIRVHLSCQGSFLVNDASRAKNATTPEAQASTLTNFIPLHHADGSVALPAASIRGALRSRTEYLLRSLDPKASGDPGAASGDGPIERLFGTTGRESRLRIDEPSMTDQHSPRKQDFVAIDRFTGGAAPGAKYDATYADRPQFEVSLRVDLEGLRPEDLALLSVALQELCSGQITLGWGAAKGYGQFLGRVTACTHQLGQGWSLPGNLFDAESDEAKTAWLTETLAQLLRASDPSPGSDSEANADIQHVHQPAKAQAAVLREGTLGWQGEGAKRKRVVHASNNKNPYQLAPGLLSKSLAASTADSVPIRFRLDQGKIVEILPIGEESSVGNAVVPIEAPQNKFANPYYFVRLDGRANSARIPSGFKDGAGVGHRRYLPHLYSGTLAVKFTVKTPLLCLAPLSEEDSKKDHKTYDLNLDNGLPLIASSSVRGMLRSAYEAITNSRLGVLPAKPEEPLEKQGNARVLGYRMEVEDGLSVVPVMIVDGKATLLMGTTESLPYRDNGRWRVRGDLYAAWVPSYQKDVAGYDRDAIKIDGHPPTHGQEAWCWLEKIRRTNPPFTFWRVRKAASTAGNLSATPPENSRNYRNYESCGEMIRAKGYFVISNQNIKNKHDERFFFGEPKTAELLPDVFRHYRTLLEDCRELHSRELKKRIDNQQSPTHYTASQREQASVAAMSRHAYEPLPGPKDTIFCFAKVKRVENRFVIESLHPVMISRKLYTKSPIDLVPKGLRPASSIDELSLADRVFGWVNQDPKKSEGEPKSAYRSHVRFGTVRCVTDASESIDEFTEPMKLAILAQPKPQQGRFYLGNRNGNAPPNGDSKDTVGYTEKNRIRGPKVYPHHQQAEHYKNAAQWKADNPNAFSREFSDQNRSITGWIKPGAEFEFDLRFENLSEVELGALLWLLTLSDDHYLRMGLGKPLGFGSVRVQLNPDRSLIALGNAWIDSIITRNKPSQSAEECVELVNRLKDQFDTAIQSYHPSLLASFKKCSHGVGALPIHYPQLVGKPSHEHFHWFVANEKRDGGRYALPDLDSPSVGLPNNPSN